MIKPESCPHLVLGISSHSRRDEASAGFARASRRVRSTNNAPFTIQDLTSALSAIEGSREGKEIRFEYSLPADPRVHKTNLRLILDTKTFSESDDLRPLIGLADYGKPPEAVGFLFLNAALYRVLLWEWSTAIEYARETLRLSRQEEVRDEALNILAVGLAMQGDTERAIDALTRAVEGRWVLGLQTNLAIVAFDKDEHLAIKQMAFVISGERDTPKRLAACKLAIAMWERYQSELLGDESDHEAPPSEILSASRTLLADPELAEDDFYELGSFLARVDPDGLRHSRSLEVSRHKKTPSGQLIGSRLEGFEDFVGHLVEVERAHRSSHPWITDDLDQMVRACFSIFIQDLESSAAAGIGFTMVKHGLDCATFERAAVRGLAIRFLATAFDDPERRPSEEIVSWLETGRRSVPNLKLVEEQSEFLTSIFEDAGNLVAIAFFRSYVHEGEQVEALAIRIQQQMGSFMNRLGADRSAVGNAASIITNWCSDVERLFPRLIVLAGDRDVKSSLVAVRDRATEIRTLMTRYVR